MNVGLVRRGYSPTGGAEAYLRRFADGLASAGHAPILFTGSDWPVGEWPYALHRLAGGRSPSQFARALAERGPDACDYLLSLERVLACDCYRAGDGVHAAWLERRARLEFPLKSAVRRFQPKHREILALERAMFQDRTARRVIANSHLVKDEIIAHYAYPADRIAVIANGVPPPPDAETSARFRQDVRGELGFTDRDFLLLFAGSGWERKGLRFAVEALNLAALEHVTLVVAGKGNRNRLPTSTRMRFLGPVPGLARWLAAADAFILPTLYDPFSNACLEALAAGLPVITTAANGFAEILTPASGSVVAPPEHVIELAAAIRHWSEPHRSAEAREALRGEGARYSVERNVQATLDFIQAALP